MKCVQARSCMHRVFNANFAAAAAAAHVAELFWSVSHPMSHIYLSFNSNGELTAGLLYRKLQVCHNWRQSAGSETVLSSIIS